MDVCTLVLLDVGQAALAARLTVGVDCHEDASTALGVGALHTGVGDLGLITIALDLVELEDTHLDVLVAVNGLLGLGEDLLLLLLALATLKWDNDIDGRVALELACSNVHLILEACASEEEVSILDGELLLDLLDGCLLGDFDHNGLGHGLNEELHLPYESFFSLTLGLYRQKNKQRHERCA